MSKIGQVERFRRAAKKALVDRNLTITALASRLGYTRNAVSMQINGRHQKGHVRRAILNELNLAE